MTTNVPNRRRSRPPSLRARGLECRFQAGRWLFRARMSVAGKVLVGPFREDQALAIADRQRMELRRKEAPLPVLTMSDAMRRVTADARARGLPESTVQKHYESHGRYLLRVFGEDLRVAELTVERVQSFAREALEAGRSSTTIVQKDLPIIARACALAGVPSPVDEVKRIMRARLRVVQRRPEFFTVEELRTLLRRMRHETFVDANGRPLELPGREADADLCEFIAGTGVRAGELGRIPLRDVDLARGVVLVAMPKDHANPRDLVVGPALRPVLERLIARAERLAARGENPDRLLVPQATWWLQRLGRRWQRRLGEPRLSGRTLRRSYVSGLIATGATAAEARDLAGHKHLSTTDRYVHAVGAARTAVSSRWTEALAAAPALPIVSASCPQCAAASPGRNGLSTAEEGRTET